MAQHRSLAVQKGIKLRWESRGTPAEVILDPQRVRQILVNLIGNALKFTDRGEVTAVSDGDAVGRLHVAIHDTGPGIDP